MKNSKVLKILSYLLIPIFVAIFIISVAFTIYQDNWIDTKTTMIDDQEQQLVSNFMLDLEAYANHLIYNKESYKKIEDGENTIFYYYLSGEGIEDLNLYIKYRNLIITNVELTSETRTFDGIKNFINSQDTKKTSIINGEVKSDTNIISKKAVQYFNLFNFEYYSTSKGNTETDEPYNYVYNESTQEEIAIYYNPHEYTTTNINDFEILASYKENVLKTNYIEEIDSIMQNLSSFENYIYIAIPISAIGTVICIVYLCFAIGNSKKSEKIELNYFDKIFYEILLTIDAILIGIILIPFAAGNAYYEYFNINLISIILTCYILIYAVCATLFNTTVKRIKAKQFWNTTITGKIVIWCWKKLKNILIKINNICKNSISNIPENKKIILYIILFTVAIIINTHFSVIGLIFDLIIILYTFNYIIKRFNSYKKIESKLKDMYEGKNTAELKESEVETEFRDSVKYINDISNGFENAIEESMKSERLKTELITNVSHDIKTPLTSIINYVDLLKEETIDNEKANEYIEILDMKSQRLKKLIEDLVEASKASSGAIKLNMENINVVELFKQAIGEFQDKFQNKGLSIITNYEKEYIYIKADSRYLYRVIENLFSNITKYALEASRVYIDIETEENKVKISVKNISKERLNISEEELMQRFVRGDKSRTTEGSGLGISIAKSLVELQNGTFKLKIDGDLFKVEIKFDK